MTEVTLGLLLGVFTAFGASISGGGFGGIIVLLLINYGLPAAKAIGTLKIGILGTVAGSTSVYRKTDLIRKDHLKVLIPIAVTATIIGPIFTLRADESFLINAVSGIVIIVALVGAVGSSGRLKGEKSFEPTRRSRILGYLAYSVVITVLAAVGSGVGLLNNYVLIGLLGMTALENIATRRAVGVVAAPVQAAFFALAGQVEWTFAVGILIGSFAGSILGTKYAIRKGNRFVRVFMSIVAIILAVTTIVQNL